MDMIRVGNNRFLCKIHDEKALKEMKLKQPSQIMGCIVLIEAFSPPTNPHSVIFTRIPLWIRFPDLTLEHMSADSVTLIAADAGEVIDVQPQGRIPRYAEGYRAQVWANIHKPLLKGTYANTLQNGNIWVSILYNNLPPLNCKLCLHLGHTQHNCHTPPQPQPQIIPAEILQIGYEDNNQAENNYPNPNAWPHHQLGLHQQPMEVMMTQQHHPHNLNMNMVEPIPQLGIDLTSTGYEQAQEAQLEQHVVVSLLNQSLNQSPNVISNTSVPSVSPPPLQAHDEVFDEIRLKNSSI
ncbi:hypothetical protein FRX31_011209, partial [Thalictrum thalictroides]